LFPPEKSIITIQLLNAREKEKEKRLVAEASLGADAFLSSYQGAPGVMDLVLTNTGDSAAVPASLRRSSSSSRRDMVVQVKIKADVSTDPEAIKKFVMSTPLPPPQPSVLPAGESQYYLGKRGVDGLTFCITVSS